MLLEERAPSPCFDDGDLSKDFGLDITVPDGGLVTSAANQRQYQAECSRIYQQFILNMADYINEEAQLRKTLTVLQSQQKKPRKVRYKRAETPKTPEAPDEDAFTAAQLEEFKNILNRESSRSKLSHASGFAAPSGADGDDGMRSQKLGHTKSISSLVNQPPVTHMFPALKERPPSVKASQLRRDSKSAPGRDSKSAPVNADAERKRSTPASLFGTDVEYDGIMEPNAELSSNRRIRMNPRAFTKLMSGQVKVKLLNKTGDFVLTPLSSGTAVLTPEETEKSLMDNKEKVAVVKQSTNFHSPTLSSDLKINNLVAIQKALKGQQAKRVTVGEVMKSARDRRARVFRVQMSGNRFDEFDQQEEDTGFVHEVKAATDLGEDEVDSRPRSRLRFSPHLQMLRQQENRPESRLRSPTPIPLHILDPHTYARINTPAPQKQISVEFSALAVHKDGSEFEHRYSQAVGVNKPQDRQRHVSVIDIGLDEPDSHIRGRPALRSTSAAGGHVAWGKSQESPTPTHVPTGVFPVSQHSKLIRSKSAVAGQGAKRDDTGTFNAKSKGVTPRDTSPRAPSPPLKKIHSMRDTACVVKRWQDDDKAREEKLNRWRMRMSFAATRKGNLAKMLTRAKSGR